MLDVHVEYRQTDPPTTVVRCVGEVDVSSCDTLIDAFDRLLTRNGSGCRVDLRAVSFIDSTGIGCLLHAAIAADKLGVPFQIVPGEATLRFITTSGVGKRLPLTADGD